MVSIQPQIARQESQAHHEAKPKDHSAAAKILQDKRAEAHAHVAGAYICCFIFHHRHY